MGVLGSLEELFEDLQGLKGHLEVAWELLEISLGSLSKLLGSFLGSLGQFWEYVEDSGLSLRHLLGCF